MNGGEQTKLLVVYARVSTARQEEEKTIDTQLLAIREFAEKYQYTIVQEYTDEGWSGDILARPSLDRLRADAKKKLWDGVLSYDPDRLARRGSYQALVMDELEELGLEVLFVTTPAPKNIEDRMLYGMKGLFAEYERAKITERTRLGKVRKAREGHVVSSEAPYGYKLVPRRGKREGADFSETHYEIDAVEAAVVRIIFSWAGDNGLSIRKIVRRLQDMNVHPRKSKRGVWNTSTLTKLLKNRTYVGEAHYGASCAIVPKNPIKPGIYKRSKKTSRKMRPEDEWIKIPTQPLIEPDLFERVQTQLVRNREFSVRNRKNEYLLAGKIRCVCGRARGGEGALGGKHLYYRCSDRILSYPLPRACNERGINARVADKIVWDKLAELMSSPDLMRTQLQNWRAKQDSRPGITIDTSILKRDLAKLNEEETRYAKAYGAGLLSINKLQELISPIKQRTTVLEQQLADINTDQASCTTPNCLLPDKDELDVFARNAKIALGNMNFSEKRDIVLNVIDTVVGTQAKLEVYGHIEIKDYVEFKTNHRDGVNTIRHSPDKDMSLPFSFTVSLPAPDYQNVKRLQPEPSGIPRACKPHQKISRSLTG